jgi:glutathione S-transferase
VAVGKFPVLVDTARDEVVAESSIIIEYLGWHYPGRTRFIPQEPDRALLARLRDRFYDLYVHLPAQRIVGDRLRPAGKKDLHGVAEARAQLRKSYAIIERQMADGGWAMGDDFSLADCAAMPSLYYGNRLEPCSEFKNVSAYLDRLKARPSFARVLVEAEPYFNLFPKDAE